MKAIVFEDLEGIKNFMVFDTDSRLFEVFSKICIGSGCKFCVSDEDFDEMKDEYDYEIQAEIIFKVFLGTGIYDYTSGDLHDVIYLEEGTYWIEEFSELTPIATIDKIKLEVAFLN